MDITQVVTALIGLAVAVLTGIVLPWLQGKLGEVRWSSLCGIAEVAVYAAEQLGITNIVIDKLGYATGQVQAALKQRGMRFDEGTVRAAIEAAVRRMNAAARD